MANSLHFNSIDLSGANYGVTVLKNSFPVAATPKVDIQETSFGAGVSQRTNYSPREFDISVLVTGTSKSNLYTRLDNLNALFAQSTELSLRFDNYFSDRYWNVRYTGGMEAVEFQGANYATTNLQFVAPNPFAYSTTERTSPDFNISGTLGSFTVESASAVGGTWYTNPVWIIKLTNGGSNVNLINNTTGESLLKYYSYSAGDWIKIDSEIFRVQVSTNSGSTWSNSMIIAGTFPRLKAGVQNSCYVSGLTDGATVSLTYRARYI